MNIQNHLGGRKMNTNSICRHFIYLNTFICVSSLKQVLKKVQKFPQIVQIGPENIFGCSRFDQMIIQINFWAQELTRQIFEYIFGSSRNDQKHIQTYSYEGHTYKYEYYL